MNHIPHVSFAALALAAQLGIGAGSATAAMPTVCQMLTPQRFAEFSAAVDAAVLALEKANAAPGVSAVGDAALYDPLKSYWAEAKRPYRADPGPLQNFDLTTTPIGDGLIGSIAPYTANVFGYEMSWRIASPQYWAGIHLFYNRQHSPQANLISTSGRTTNQLSKDYYFAVSHVDMLAQSIGAISVACMDALPW